jgi:hypothetical protein
MDLRSGIQDPGVKKAPDPGSGFATLGTGTDYLKRLQNKLSTMSSDTEGQRSCGDFKAEQSGKNQTRRTYCTCTVTVMYNKISETEIIIYTIMKSLQKNFL